MENGFYEEFYTADEMSELLDISDVTLFSYLGKLSVTGQDGKWSMYDFLAGIGAENRELVRAKKAIEIIEYKGPNISKRCNIKRVSVSRQLVYFYMDEVLEYKRRYEYNRDKRKCVNCPRDIKYSAMDKFITEDDKGRKDFCSKKCLDDDKARSDLPVFDFGDISIHPPSLSFNLAESVHRQLTKIANKIGTTNEVIANEAVLLWIEMHDRFSGEVE